MIKILYLGNQHSMPSYLSNASGRESWEFSKEVPVGML
jgi:hypothetical protein